MKTQIDTIEFDDVLDNVLDALGLTAGAIPIVDQQDNSDLFLYILKVDPDSSRLQELYESSPTARMIIDDFCAQGNRLSLERLGLSNQKQKGI